jgi:hypothetical protein
MKGKLLLTLAALLLAGAAADAAPLGTAISYQGRLDDSGNPANGTYSFRYRLLGDAAGTTQIGPVVDSPNQAITDGLLNAPLDFGATAFTGEARWLEISVKQGGPGLPTDYLKLNPQPLPPAPASHFSRLAGNVLDGVITGQKLAPLAITTTHISDGAITAPKLGPASITSGNVANNAITAAKIASGQVVKSLNGLRDDVSLAAGANVTLTPNGNTLTIASSGGGNGLTLPFSGSGSSADGLFQVNNSGSGAASDGMVGMTGSSASQVSGVRGVATSASGVVVGVYGRATESPAGTGIVGYGGATGGYFTSTRPGGRAGVFDGDVSVNGKASIGALDVGMVTGNLSLAGATSEAALGILSLSGWAPEGLQPPTRFIVRREGTVGIGTANPQATLDVRGTTQTRVLTITGGADIAEPFPLKEEEIEKGSVVIIDDQHPGRLKRSTQAYDTRVAGIVSGANGINPGIALKQEGALDQGENVALTGRVYVQADASFGVIKPGDLLTTSDTPGHAMKVTDLGRAQGAILGKAMTALVEGKGMVLVLVTLQ